MSDWWTFRVLCPPNESLAFRIRTLISDLLSLGYSAPSGNDAVWCTSADGSGAIPFDSVERAASWLAVGEGLLPIQIEDFSVDLSVHRREGILRLEMEHLPDEPIYDVVALSVPSQALDDVWPITEQLLQASLVALPFAFAYAINDATAEAMSKDACVHRRVASNRLPPFLPWLLAIPQDSPLSAAFDFAASIVDRPITESHGVRTLTLTDVPGTREQEVLRSSALWRRATQDDGCV